MDKAQREQCLIKMQAASDAFYKAAVLAGNHAFIEFTGLMNEFIKICQENHDRGIDFTDANTHCSTRMKVAPYQMNYLREKLGCIFDGIQEVQKAEIVNITADKDFDMRLDQAVSVLDNAEKRGASKNLKRQCVE